MREIAYGSGVDAKKVCQFVTEAERFEGCGDESLLLECRSDGLQFSTQIRCRSRICDDCGRSYYGEIVERFKGIVKLMMMNRRKGYYCCLLTLTVSTDRFAGRMPNRDDIVRFYRESAQFLRLFCGRYRGVFTKTGKVREDRRVTVGAGSISVVEVGKGNNNLHLHAVVYMPYTALSVMREAWKRITGDSYRVGLERAKSVRNVTNYILKYITKPPQTDSFAELASYAWMIKGSRRLRSSGVFYNDMVLPKKPRKLRCCCPYCAGRLTVAAIAVTAGLESCVVNLWQLLRMVAETGKSLVKRFWRAPAGLVTYPPQVAPV